MSNQTFLNMKLYEKAVLKEIDKFFDMNDKSKNFILFRILDQIQQNNADVRDGINKYLATICNKFTLSRYSMFCFFMLFLSAVNHTLVYILISF